MKRWHKMDNESIRNLVMLELVAPEDPSKRLISEDESKALYLRYNEGSRDWGYVFEPIKDKGFRDKMIQLYKTLDNDNEG